MFIIMILLFIILFWLGIYFAIWFQGNKEERCWIVTSDGRILPAIIKNYIGGQYYIVETTFDLLKVKKIYKTYMEARGG